LVFEKNANFFRRKLAKIAENCDHNIYPCFDWLHKIRTATHPDMYIIYATAARFYCHVATLQAVRLKSQGLKLHCLKSRLLMSSNCLNFSRKGTLGHCVKKTGRPIFFRAAVFQRKISTLGSFCGSAVESREKINENMKDPGFASQPA
jgi:hypothetical protein